MQSVQGTVLLADANVTTRPMLAQQLARHGYRVVEAESVEQTMAAARKGRGSHPAGYVAGWDERLGDPAPAAKEGSGEPHSHRASERGAGRQQRVAGRCPGPGDQTGGGRRTAGGAGAGSVRTGREGAHPGGGGRRGPGARDRADFLARYHARFTWPTRASRRWMRAWTSSRT